jgi:phosphomannomutase
MGKDLSAIFKAYDIRGIYPSELDEEIAKDIGAAFAAFVEKDRVAVGRDMRVSSPGLASAFAEGVRSTGTDVIDVGEVSTDALYFAAGRLEVPGAMFTASHNPAEYNGIKLCRERAIPIGSDTGMETIKEVAQREGAGTELVGRLERKNVLEDYAQHCRSLIDRGGLRPLKVAIDAGNGMAGKTVPIVFKELPFDALPLYFELDGTFPNHPANPIEPANVADLQRVVLDEGCDVGLAFDGDADRVFLVDEKAEPISGSLTTALVAERLLKKSPGETILYNLICSWVVPEVINESGGKPMRTRVGHSFIKKIMAETGAIFGGEHSGHYYFRDNFYADSGMIAALIILEAISDAGKPLSELLAPFRRYYPSGEINSVVTDQKTVLERLTRNYSDGNQDWTDGLTVEYGDWWFNVRPSNTEPLLRLNLETKSETQMKEKSNEVLTVIREGA